MAKRQTERTCKSCNKTKSIDNFKGRNKNCNECKGYPSFKSFAYDWGFDLTPRRGRKVDRSMWDTSIGFRCNSELKNKFTAIIEYKGLTREVVLNDLLEKYVRGEIGSIKAIQDTV